MWNGEADLSEEEEEVSVTLSRLTDEDAWRDGKMMYDQNWYIYLPTDHEPENNLRRYKCLLHDGGEFGVEKCPVSLTTSNTGDIISRVKDIHNHRPQKDLIEMRKLEVEEWNNVAKNIYRLGAREAVVNMTRKASAMLLATLSVVSGVEWCFVYNTKVI